MLPSLFAVDDSDISRCSRWYQVFDEIIGESLLGRLETLRYVVTVSVSQVDAVNFVSGSEADWRLQSRENDWRLYGGLSAKGGSAYLSHEQVSTVFYIKRMDIIIKRIQSLGVCVCPKIKLNFLKKYLQTWDVQLRRHRCMSWYLDYNAHRSCLIALITLEYKNRSRLPVLVSPLKSYSTQALASSVLSYLFLDDLTHTLPVKNYVFSRTFRISLS